MSARINELPSKYQKEVNACYLHSNIFCRNTETQRMTPTTRDLRVEYSNETRRLKTDKNNIYVQFSSSVAQMVLPYIIFLHRERVVNQVRCFNFASILKVRFKINECWILHGCFSQ